MYDAILLVKIELILDKLEISYSRLGSSLGLWENNKTTDGRRANIEKNYINDFSCKNRACGSPFPFVKSYLGLSDKETFKRFEDNFGISNTEKSSKLKQKINKKEQKKPVYSRNW